MQSLLVITQNIEQEKSRVEIGNLYTEPAFQIFFHSFPQTGELKTAVFFFFYIGWTKEKLKEDIAMGSLFPPSLVSDWLWLEAP